MKIDGTEMTTKIYENNKLVREEELITLGNWVKYGRLCPGQKLTLWWKNKEDLWTTKFIYVGDCTPYCQPTTDDGGIGWDWEGAICKKYVIEVRTYEEN